jgi:hypothetical protein
MGCRSYGALQIFALRCYKDAAPTALKIFALLFVRLVPFAVSSVLICVHPWLKIISGVLPVIDWR